MASVVIGSGDVNGAQFRIVANYTVTESNGIYGVNIQSISIEKSAGNKMYFDVHQCHIQAESDDPYYFVSSTRRISMASNSTSAAIASSVSRCITNLDTRSKWFAVRITFDAYYERPGEATWWSTGIGWAANGSENIPARVHYTVSYNANGGTGAPSSQEKVHNVSLTLWANKPTRNGYVFKCWNTNSSGTGTNYNPGGSYTGNANLTLYAIWYQNYTVNYNANGGTGAPSAQTKVYGTNLTLSSTKPTRSGYTFVRWNTNTSNTGTAYNPGGTYSANANVTLYAIWNTTVSYNANGGTGAPAAQTKVFNTNLTLTSAKPTRNGYSFWHWNTNTSNTGTTYNSGATYSTHSPMTLYAIWNPLIYYQGNGVGAGNLPTTQTKTFGQNTSISSQTPTRAGHEFLGWNTKSDGTGTAYAKGASYTADTTLTLYAQWRKTANPPTISAMSVVRCNSSGTADDEGLYFKCTVSWSVDTTSQDVPNNQLTSLTGSYVPSDGGTAVTWSEWNGTSTGTSGTAYAIVGGGNVDTDTQYLVTVSATDKKPQTTSRTDILTRAFFIMDFNANGDAVGIGSAAPQSGLEIGWSTQMDDDLTVLGDIEASNYKVTSKTQSASGDVISASGTWMILSAQAIKCGHLCHVYVSAKNSEAVSAGSSSQIGTLANGWTPYMLATFGCPYGGGYISGSSLYLMPHVTLSANTTVNVSATFYVD